jgi:excisionase family DNA binding protein
MSTQEDFPNKDPAISSEFLTIPEVASRLRVSRAYAYRLVKNGLLKEHVFGGALRVSKEDLAAFIKQSAR